MPKQKSKRFSDGDNEAILRYIILYGLARDLHDNETWKEMENNILIKHSWQSMKKHFKQYLANNLVTYIGRPEITASEIRDITLHYNDFASPINDIHSTEQPCSKVPETPSKSDECGQKDKPPGSYLLPHFLGGELDNSDPDNPPTPPIPLTDRQHSSPFTRRQHSSPPALSPLPSSVSMVIKLNPLFQSHNKAAPLMNKEVETKQGYSLRKKRGRPSRSLALKRIWSTTNSQQQSRVRKKSKSSRNVSKRTNTSKVSKRSSPNRSSQNSVENRIYHGKVIPQSKSKKTFMTHNIDLDKTPVSIPSFSTQQLKESRSNASQMKSKKRFLQPSDSSESCIKNKIFSWMSLLPSNNSIPNMTSQNSPSILEPESRSYVSSVADIESLAESHNLPMKEMAFLLWMVNGDVTDAIHTLTTGHRQPHTASPVDSPSTEASLDVIPDSMLQDTQLNPNPDQFTPPLWTLADSKCIKNSTSVPSLLKKYGMQEICRRIAYLSSDLL